MPKDFVLSVMALDRVGIVADLTEGIVELGGNIDAISQTVMRGYFTIIVAARFEEPMNCAELAEAVRARGGPGELEVSVKERRPAPPSPVPPGAERFILTITGPDRKGILHRFATHLASRNVNIEDLYATAEDGRFLLIAQLQVPPAVELERLQLDMASLWPGGEMRVSLQHENVFLATSHVDFRHRSSRR